MCKKITILFLMLLVNFTINAYAGKTREGTEWDVRYWYNANQNMYPRILLIGDSITNGYQPQVRNNLSGAAYVSFWASSKCITDRSYLKVLAFMLDEYDYDVIHINNGLHSLSTVNEDWGKCLLEALKLIHEKQPKANIIWCSSTPLKDDEMTNKVVALNKTALTICKKYRIEINDLFSMMNPLDREKYWSDTYHFKPAAIEMQAKEISGVILNALGIAKINSDAAKKSLEGAESLTGPNGKLLIGFPKNALENGALDTKNKWGFYPAEPAKMKMEIDNTEKTEGKGSAKISTSISKGQFYYPKPNLKPGKSYTIIFSARAEKDCEIRLHFRTRRPPYVFFGKQDFAISNKWKKLTSDFVAPESYSSDDNTMFFIFHTPGIYWLDNVQILEANRTE